MTRAEKVLENLAESESGSPSSSTSGFEKLTGISSFVDRQFSGDYKEALLDLVFFIGSDPKLTMSTIGKWKKSVVSLGRLPTLTDKSK